MVVCVRLTIQHHGDRSRGGNGDGSGGQCNIGFVDPACLPRHVLVHEKVCSAESGGGRVDNLDLRVIVDPAAMEE